MYLTGCYAYDVPVLEDGIVAISLIVVSWALTLSYLAQLFYHGNFQPLSTIIFIILDLEVTDLEHLGIEAWRKKIKGANPETLMMILKSAITISLYRGISKPIENDFKHYFMENTQRSTVNT